MSGSGGTGKSQKQKQGIQPDSPVPLERAFINHVIVNLRAIGGNSMKKTITIAAAALLGTVAFANAAQNKGASTTSPGHQMQKSTTHKSTSTEKKGTVALSRGSNKSTAIHRTQNRNPLNAYARVGKPPAPPPPLLAGQMSSKNHEMYMKSLRESGYDPKNDYTKVGTMNDKLP
jgi:hypothetical protein